MMRFLAQIIRLLQSVTRPTHISIAKILAKMAKQIDRIRAAEAVWPLLSGSGRDAALGGRLNVVVAGVSDLSRSDTSALARGGLEKFTASAKHVLDQHEKTLLRIAVRDTQALVLALLAIDAAEKTYDGKIRSLARHYLVEKLGDEVVEEMLSALKREDALVRWHAIWVLRERKVKAREVVAALIGALGDADADVRREAVETLEEIGDVSSAEAVSALAKSDPDTRVREAAARIAAATSSDQELLAQIAMTTYSEAGRAAVAKLTDQAILAEIAKNAKYSDVRKAAVEKLSEQAVLVEIAKNAKDSDVRKAAVEKLSDQAVLVEIALNDGDRDVCKSAVNKLTDQVLLAEIAKNAKDEYVRVMVVERLLTDQAVLAEIAKNDKNAYVRGMVAKNPNFTDQAILTEIAKNGEYPWMRKAAVEKLSDQAILAEIAKNDETEDVRKAAMEKLSDQAILAVHVHTP